MKMAGRFAAIVLGTLMLAGCSPESKREGRTHKEKGGGSAEELKTDITVRSTSGGGKKNGAGTGAKAGTSEPVAAKTARAATESTGPVVIVSGTVTLYDGRPATSVSVELKCMRKTDSVSSREEVIDTAETDAQGRYEVKGADANFVWLIISGNVPSTRVRLEHNSLYNENIKTVRRLKQDVKLSQAFTVKGRIVNEKDEAMAGLGVVARAAYRDEKSGDTGNRVFEERETTSTQSGEFVFDNLDGGLWMVGVAAPDYAPVVQKIDVPVTETLTLKLAAKGGTVKGHVYLKATGAGVSGMAVSLGRQSINAVGKIEHKSTTSTVDGSFEFVNVPAGDMHISVKSDEKLRLGLAPPGVSPVRVAEGETTDVVVFVYPGSRVTGMVYDKDTSEPLSNVAISLRNLPYERSSQSDNAGMYSIDGIFAGEKPQVTFQVKLNGYGVVNEARSGYGTEYISVPLGDDEELVKKDIPMTALVKVRGKVVSREEMPVSHAQVGLVTQRSFGSVNTIGVKPDGSFELETLPFSQAFVEATAKGFATAKSDPLDITTNDIDGLKIIMDVGGTIQGTVLEPDGKPSQGAKISSSKSYSFGSSSYRMSNPAVTTGEDGSFIIQDAPLTIELKATQEEFAESEEITLNLKAGETRSGVVLNLREGMTIEGRVVTSDKKGVEGATAYSQGETYSQKTTDKDGAFKLENLPEGVYTVSVSAKGAYKSVQGIKTGTKGLEIVINDEQKFELIGTVIDDITDKVIRDFSVTADDSSLKFEKQSGGTFKATGLQANFLYNFKISAPDLDQQTFRVHVTGKQAVQQQTFRLGKGGIIVGRVIERGTGKPVKDVVVASYNGTQSWEWSESGPSSHSTSDAEGKFVLAPVPTGPTTVIVKPQQPFTTVAKTVTVSSEQTADVGDIELATGGVIYGTVIRGKGGEAVPNYQVRLYSYENSLRTDKKVMTDAEGKFRFEQLPATTYNVSVGSMTEKVVLEPAGEIELTLKLGGVTMSGTVIRGGIPTATSVSGSISGGRSVSTYAQNGEYKLADIEPGTYTFQVGSNAEVSETVEVPDVAEFKKDFTLPDGRIVVTVVDASGKAVEGADVDLSKQSSGTGFDQRWLSNSTGRQSDASGRVEFTGLPTGTFSVSARKDDAGSAMKSSIQVQDGQTQDVQLKLDTNGGTIISVALSSATGQGIPEAWCYLYGPNGQFNHNGQRDSAGVMTISNVPPGTYTTNVSYWSHSQSEKQVEVKAGETVTIEDVLYPAGAIHWTLEKGDGSAAADATVTVSPISTTPEERVRTGKTNSTGLFVERGLAPGTYQVTAQLPGKAAVSDTFEVGAGENSQKSRKVAEW